MTASGHENSKRNCGKQAKAAAVNDSSDQSRQCDVRGATSGQKTTTGHAETTRANAMKPLAVRRPPTIAPRLHKAKQQTRLSTPTASRLLNEHGKQSTREPINQERAQTPSRLPKPKIGRPGRTLTGAVLGRLTRPTTSPSVQR